ncbi:MAG: hypothetical protein AAF748_10490 [Pseudomonadota bacterium]
MPGMFDTARPDPAAVERVKALFAATFDLPEDVLLSVAELRCHEPGCPPIETVVTARRTAAPVRDWRLHKSIKEIEPSDVTALAARLADQGGSAGS